MDLFPKANPKLDLIRLLRMGGMTSDFRSRTSLKELDALMSQLRALEMSSRIRLSDDISMRALMISGPMQRGTFRPIIKSRCSLAEVTESL